VINQAFIPWNEVNNCGWNDIVVDAATAPGLELI